MHRYFLEQQERARNGEIPQEDVQTFCAAIVRELKALGATENEIALLQDGAVRNAIREGASPKDVAWAIMQ